jgi:taurine dioxygenase
MAAIAASLASAVQVDRLTGSIAAEVRGVDLDAEIAADVADVVRGALAEHAVLVFRNPGGATPEMQTRLAAVFGEPQPLDTFQFLGAMRAATAFDPGSRIASSDEADAPKASRAARRTDLNDVGLGGEFDGWHSDSSFTPWLPKAAVLRAEVIPPVGGDTCFSSLAAAYDALSPMMKSWLDGVQAVHIVPDGYKEGINLDLYGADAQERFDAAYPPRAWPLVVRHPETGRRALFINPGYTVHVEGLKRAESHSLLRFLCRHVASASFVYRHHWRLGDLVVWDEVMALHRAPDDFAPHHRKVVRVTAGRQVPTAA